MVWLWVTVSIFFMNIIFMMSFVHFKLLIKREKANDLMLVDLKGFFGLVHYRYNIPVVHFINLQGGTVFKTEEVNKKQNDLLADEKGQITKSKMIRYYEETKVLLSNVFEFSEWFTGLLSHVRCTKLRWHSQIGIGDAPETAVSTGIVWGLKTLLLGFVFRYIRLEDKHPELAVNPVYNKFEFATEVICNFKIRFGYAIIAVLLLILRIMKVKGGMKKWQQQLFKTS